MTTGHGPLELNAILTSGSFDQQSFPVNFTRGDSPWGNEVRETFPNIRPDWEEVGGEGERDYIPLATLSPPE